MRSICVARVYRELASNMHVITFYSYKGGTGRSMALVNIAAELIKSGLRVLIVDFDLEAPGLDTFNLPRPQKVGKGVVEFVLDYLETNQSRGRGPPRPATP